MPDHLWRDLGFVLAAKLAALMVLYLLFFGPQHQPLVDQARMAGWILGSQTWPGGR